MARKIVLISCASKKRPSRSKAKDLYTSTLFTLNLQFAFSLNPDGIYILSAKHGLLELETEIEPYNLTLNNMSNDEIKKWALKVLSQLREKTDLDNDIFIFLAGDKYRKYLIPHIKSYEVPLTGLPIGKQLHYLKSRI